MATRKFGKLFDEISLAGRLLIGSGAAMALACAMILYSVILGEIKSNREDLQKQAEYQLKFVAPTVANHAVLGDYAAIEQTLKSTADLPDVESVTWHDSRGNSVPATTPVAKSEAPKWFVRWVDIPSAAHTEDIVVGGERYGGLEIKLDPTKTVNGIWQGFVDKIQILILGLGIFFSVTLFIITNGLRPIYALTSSAERFGKGDYSVRVEAEGAPEILSGINAFNSMADSIGSLVTSLSESDANNRRLAAIVEQSNEAIITRDLKGTITTWNSGAEALFGYKADEAIGRHVSLLQPPGASAEPWLSDDHSVLSQEATYEAQRVARRGERVDIEMSIAPLMNESGALAGVIGISRDIRERKAAQVALQAAKEAAEAANQAKSQFLANMSHEIRTPMNGVLGMTELLLSTNLSDKQRQFAQTVYSSGEALLAVINDILDFSKIEAGKLELEHIEFDPRQVVEDVSELLAGRAHIGDVEVICYVDDRVPDQVIGDPGRFRQVITNLLGNAVKFTEHGEVVVRVDLDKPGASGGVTLKVAVKDTGPGIPAEAKEKIFEAFAQADGSTTRKFGGTGLGLTIARQLVDLMGGRIGVESELGRGSTFWFTVPMERGTAPAAQKLSADDLHGLPVLVVDDNATNREILHQQLSGWGMHVESAGSGDGALVMARSSVRGRTYRLAILDMNMPEMDGIELSKQLRLIPEYAQLPIVILSSVGKDIPASILSRVGINRWITKPVRKSQLLHTLTNVLNYPNATEPMAKTGTFQGLSKLTGRVLVAEDNPVNQQVALAILQSLGCDVVVVDNGLDAVTALDREKFDAVLMDCHMPELDGFAATALVREKGVKAANADRRVTIVALTANAMHGDRERCLAAGMDDYLAKPFNRDQLYATLRKWLPHQDHSDEPEPVAANSGRPAAKDAPVDADTLDRIRALDPKNGEQIVRMVVDRYFESAPKLITSMLDGAAKRDGTAVQVAAHTLKSSSANVGALHLSEMCKAIEQRCRAGEPPFDGATMDGVKTEYGRVKAALSAVVSAST